MSIDLIPDIKKYPHISDALKEGKLIIFVGAGLSSLWGCKRWHGVASSLVDACYRNGKITYWEQENLKNKYASSPRKLITITRSMLGDEKYLECLKSTLEVSADKKAKLPKLFESLFNLKAIYVTTNIDENLSSLFRPENVFTNPDRFEPANIKPGNIFHAHGVIRDLNTMVMTIDEYVKRYQNQKLIDFLQTIFYDESYRVLFIGYGVDEMEIIDYMVEKYSEAPKPLRGLIHKFYILLPFFRAEETMLRHEELYFEKIGMSVISYAIDAVGYDQLHENLEIWLKELTPRPGGDDFYKRTGLIEEHL